MALLDFPSGPTQDVTTYTSNGNTWKWNGTSWVAFNNLSLSSQVSGILGTLYGGTGKSLSGMTVGSVFYADTSSSFAALSPGTNNYVLATQGNGSAPYWKIDDSGTGSVGNGTTYGFTYYSGLNTVTSGTAFSYIVGQGAGGSGGTVILTSSTMALIGSTITAGTWAGSAITLTYGGTNGTNSGTALSNQIAVYNNAGMAITQILSSSSTGNSILLQASQNVTPQWVSQSTLLVGSATTAANVVIDASIATRYLVGTILNSASGNTTLSTGSGITIGNNLLTSLNLVASGTTSSTSTSTGALVVAGGVGIGGSLWTSATNFSSISGLAVSNSVITVGVWAGTAITNATNAANTAITDDTSTSSAQYITWVGGTSSNQAQKVTSSRLTFVPSSGVLTATSFSGSGANLTSVVNQLSANTGILLSGSTGNISISNVGVLSLTGTADQVLVNATPGTATTGVITLTLPQSINTTSSPQFANIVISSGTNSTLASVGPNPTSMINKQYVDNLASGLDIHGSVRALQFSAIGASYVQTQTAGSAATGAYLISTTQVALPSIDGVSFVATGATQRVLIAGGATGRTSYNGGAFTNIPTNPNIVNGIYFVGALGGAGTSNWILVRATDTDDNTELTAGTFVFIEEGNTYADSGWVCTNDTTNNGPIQFGLDNATTGVINFTQFTGAAALTMGQGLVKSGNTIGVKANIDFYGPVSNLTVGSGGAGYSSFSIGGFLSGSAGTSFSATLRVGTATTYGSGTAAIVLNETGFSMTGGTNTPKTLTITGDISLPSPTQYAIAYGTGSALAFVLNGQASSGASVLTQTNGSNPVYLSQSQLSVGSATTAAAVVTDASTATRYLIGTTLNTGSANTTLSTGSGITIGNNLLTSLNLVASGSTSSTSTSTGALIVTGGVGIGGSLWTSATNYASISGLAISNGVVLSGTWAGNAITLTYGGTNNNISGSGHSNKVAVYNAAGTSITSYTITQGNVIFGATGGTFAGLASTLLPVAAISSTPPAQPGGAIGSTQAGQLWWDSEYGVLKIYYAGSGGTSQWVDATPVLGSSGGGSSTKRSYVMTFGAGFTPSTGADTVQIQIPYAPDNTSKYYYIKRLDYRNETLSGGTGASFFIERFTGGNAAFTSPARIFTAGAGAGSSFVIGESTYTAAWTLASSGASFVSSSGVAGSVISGDYMRLNFTTVNSAATLSVSMILEEQ